MQRHKNIITYVVSLLIFIPSFCLAESPYLRFSHLTAEDGLSNNSTSIKNDAILQDKRGFLWFGTQDGLNRYDGYNITVFRPDPTDKNSISHNYVTALYEDENGFLWVGTIKGLNKFDPKSEKFYLFDEGIPNEPIRALAGDSKGHVLASALGDIYEIDLASGQTHKYVMESEQHDGKDSSMGESLFIGRDGVIWSNSSSDIYQISTDENRVMPVDSINEKIPRVENETINKVFEDRDGHIWIATNTNLHRFDSDSGMFEANYLGKLNNSDESYEISDIIQDEEGRVWVAAYGKGLFYIDKTHQSVASFSYDPAVRNGLNNNFVNDLYLAKNNKIYVGTLRGINAFWTSQLALDIPVSKTKAEPVPYHSVIEDSDKRLWIGTFGNGIIRYDGDSKTVFRHIPNKPDSLASDRVTRIFEDNKQQIWVGTYGGGLNKYDEDTQGFIRYKGHNAISSIVQDSSGRIWAGYVSYGIGRVDEEKKQVVTAYKDTFRRSVTALIADNNILWIGSISGLTRINVDTGEQVLFTHNDADPESLSASFILSLYKDKDENLWVGTYGGGVSIFDPTSKKFNHLTQEDGLPSNAIFSIIESDDERDIWLGTGKGLSHINRKDRTITNFEKRDGLLNEDFSQGAVVQNSKGEMLMGTASGLVRFYPDKLKKNRNRPSLQFTDFMIFNESVGISAEPLEEYTLTSAIGLTDTIELSHKEKLFSFRFAAINPDYPELINYSYKLEGWDKNWIKTELANRTASYTNIPAGNYTLKIRAQDQNGFWQDVTHSIELSITPPFWLTTWSYIIYGLLVLALFFFAIHVRTRYLRVRAKNLEKIVQQRTHEIEVQKAAVEELFVNVSHEFRTPLTLILGPIKRLIQDTKNQKIVDSLRPALTSANRLLRMINQLLDLSRVHTLDRHGETVDATAKLRQTLSYFDGITQEKNLSFNCHLENNASVEMTHDIFEKIYVNLIYNAIKYSPNDTAIDISCKIIESTVEITVKDYGIGINAEDQSKIFDRFIRLEQDGDTSHGTGIGLALVKEAVEHFGGKISVDSTLGQGAAFIVRLPYSKHKANDTTTALASPNTQDELDYLQDAANPISTDTANSSGLDMQSEKAEKPSVLIVEDNHEMRQFIEQSINPHFQCLLAENGTEGVKIALEHIPDIILTDLMMPLKSGMELAKTLRADEKTFHIPIIFLTAKNDIESRKRAWATDIDDYIEKPFDTEELLLRIQGILNIRKLSSRRLSNEVTNNTTKALSVLDERDQQFINKLNSYIEATYSDQDLTPKDISDHLAMSQRQLQRKIKALIDQTVSEYVRAYRLKKGAELLSKGKPISHVCYDVGFASSTYFSSCFKAHYGVTPTSYQKN